MSIPSQEENEVSKPAASSPIDIIISCPDLLHSILHHMR